MDSMSGLCEHETMSLRDGKLPKNKSNFLEGNNEETGTGSHSVHNVCHRRAVPLKRWDQNTLVRSVERGIKGPQERANSRDNALKAGSRDTRELNVNKPEGHLSH